MSAAPRKVALIMGVANQRSIALSCMESFLQKGGWDVVYTVQNERARSRVQSVLQKQESFAGSTGGKILGDLVCDVSDTHSTQLLFRESLPEILQHNKANLQAVIHSIAFCPDLKTPLLETTRESFREAHDISAYSLIEVARESMPLFGQNDEESTNSITTLSYLGSQFAIPGYHAMGPAKASLESIVRGLALEMGQQHTAKVRVNAVRAGPIPTLSSKGGIAGFELMRQDVQNKAPLGNVSASEVASTVFHVAAEATGMTGQTINVDGGYSIVGGPAPI